MQGSKQSIWNHGQPQSAATRVAAPGLRAVRWVPWFLVASAGRRVQHPSPAGDGLRSPSRKTGSAAPVHLDRATRPQRSTHSGSSWRRRQPGTKALHPARPSRRRRDDDQHGCDRAHRDCVTRHGRDDDGPPPPIYDDWSPARRSRQARAPPPPRQRSQRACTSNGRHESPGHLNNVALLRF
jgi:hypothetical protein